jgi:RNA polymerase sigma factor (sigma-70 family)
MGREMSVDREREQGMEIPGFQELLERARAGDRDAMERLLVLVRPHLERTAREYADPDNTTESASDIVQESWFRAWDRLAQFHGGEDDAETLAMFRAWIAQIARNCGLKSRRRRRTLKRAAPRGKVARIASSENPSDLGHGGGGVDPVAATKTPSARLRGEEEAERVRAALDALADSSEREIVRLRFFEGLSLRQICERLELSYDQVRDRFHKGMERIGRVLRQSE